MGDIRIIAGQYRRRKIPVIDAPDLRPTPDRGRVTLFNWLQNYLLGAVCLDAFAGSGVLGFEACSRGAKQVIFIEKEYRIFKQLQQTQLSLDCHNCQLIYSSALDWITSSFHQPDKNFAASLATNNTIHHNTNGGEHLHLDIVFVDPPFRDRQLLFTFLALLASKDILNKGGFACLEMPDPSSAQPGSNVTTISLPSDWLRYAQCIKQQRIGNSWLELWRKQ